MLKSLGLRIDMITKINDSYPDLIKVFGDKGELIKLYDLMCTLGLYATLRHNTPETSVEYNIKEFSKKIQELKDIGAVIIK